MTYTKKLILFFQNLRQIGIFSGWPKLKTLCLRKIYFPEFFLLVAPFLPQACFEQEDAKIECEIDHSNSGGPKGQFLPGSDTIKHSGTSWQHITRTVELLLAYKEAIYRGKDGCRGMRY